MLPGPRSFRDVCCSNLFLSSRSVSQRRKWTELMLLDAYAIREESRKSWDHIVTDKFVHILKGADIGSDSLRWLTKYDGEWVEMHGDIRQNNWNLHFITVIE